MAITPLRTLVRHQFAAALATVVDFGTMVALVEGFGVGPVGATAAGTAASAVVHFALARGWVFDDHGGAAAPQALRYALVAAASLVLNGAGVELVAVRLGVHYLLARAGVALVVSLLWNFPLHRRYVFPSVLVRRQGAMASGTLPRR